MRLLLLCFLLQWICIGTTFAQADAGVEAVFVQNPCKLASTSVAVRLKNYGNTAVPADSLFFILNTYGSGNTGAYPHTLSATLLAGHDTLIVLPGVNLSNAGNTNFWVLITLPGDPVAANNSLTVTRKVYNLYKPELSAIEVSTDTICSGQRLNLSVQPYPALSFVRDSWTGNGVFQAPMNSMYALYAPEWGAYALPTQSGVYQYTRTYGVGNDTCIQTAFSPYIYVRPNPVAQAAVSRQAVCAGDTVALSVSANSAYEIAWFAEQRKAVVPGTPGNRTTATAPDGGAVRDTLQLLSGTLVNAPDSLPSPYAAGSRYTRQQYLLLATELQAQRLQPGYLKGLAFEVSALNNMGYLSSFRIKLGHTRRNDLIQSAFVETGLVEVLHETGFFPDTSWNIHSFDTWFFWDGVSNLVVELETHMGIAPPLTAHAGVRGDATPFVSVAYATSTSLPAYAPRQVQAHASVRPNIRLTGDVLPAGTAPLWHIDAPRDSMAVATLTTQPTTFHLRVTDTTTGCFYKASLPVAVTCGVLAAEVGAFCAGNPAPLTVSGLTSGQTVELYDTPVGGNLLASGTTLLTTPPVAVADTFFLGIQGSLNPRTPIVVMPNGHPVVQAVVTDPSACTSSDGSISLTGVSPFPAKAPVKQYGFTFSSADFNSWNIWGLPAELLDVDFHVPAATTIDLYLNQHLFLQDLTVEPFSINDDAYLYGTLNDSFSHPEITQAQAVLLRGETETIPIFKYFIIWNESGILLESGGPVYMTSPAPPACQYHWNTGDTTATLADIGPGYYTVTATLEGCAATTSYVLGQSAAVPAGFSADVVNGSVYQFAPTVAGATGFYYDFGDPINGNTNTSTAASPVHGFSQPGQYTVTQVVTGSSGCINTDVQTISVDAAMVSGRVWKGSGGAKAGAARVWLLRQQSPNGPFVAVDSQTVTLPDTLFSFPIPFGYTEPFLLFATLLPQDTGYTHWQPTYYGDTPLKAQATRAKATTLTSLADIHLGKSTGTEAGVPAPLLATVSPNPSASSLFISWQEGTPSWTATLYAPDGRQVLAQACAGEHATLSVAHLPTGVYLLRVSGGGKEAAFRVVKE